MLNRNEVVPMYQQIADFLRKQIMEGVYKEGNKIPTELELIEQFKVSRTTVRLAVNQLIEKGLVDKKPGKGTFVRKNKPHYHLNEFKSLYDTLLESNIVAETELIHFQKTKAGSKTCDLLDIGLSDEVLEVSRLYHVDGNPIALSKVTIHPKYVNYIDYNEAKNHPMFQILEQKFGFKIKQANLEIYAEKPAVDIFKCLKISEHDPVIVMERVLYTDKGEPIEHALAYFRADSYRFTISLPGGDHHSLSHINQFKLKVKKE